MAQRRNRNPVTVRNQLSRLYKKLGVKNSAQAAVLAKQWHGTKLSKP